MHRIDDLPNGEYTVHAAEYYSRRLAKPINDRDVDWVGYTKKITISGGNEVQVDTRYFQARIDPAAGEIRIDPAKDSYQLGETVKVVVPLINRGNSPERVTFGFPANPVSIPDEIEKFGSSGSMALKKAVLPGETTEVTFTVKLDDPEMKDIGVVILTVNASDTDWTNNHSSRDIKIVVPSEDPSPTETTTPATSPTTTTTTPAAPAGGAQDNNNDGLAGTGAAPLIFLLVGGLLLGGGALTVLVARRRRA